MPIKIIQIIQINNIQVTKIKIKITKSQEIMLVNIMMQIFNNKNYKMQMTDKYKMRISKNKNYKMQMTDKYKMRISNNKI